MKKTLSKLKNELEKKLCILQANVDEQTKTKMLSNAINDIIKTYNLKYYDDTLI